jgi:hypothetical protein
MLNKILLVAIAAGLWANVAATVAVRPANASTEQAISQIADSVRDIQREVRFMDENIMRDMKDKISTITDSVLAMNLELHRIGLGKCNNDKLC